MIKREIVFVSLLLVSIFLFSGCSTQAPQVPPIGSHDVSLPGKVVWHDLVTMDVNAARKFYGELLGWTFEEISPEYVLARNNGRLVAGIAGLGSDERSSYWMPLVSISDIDDAVEVADEENGEVLLEAFELPGRGEVAVLRDPQGAAFGVVQSSTGDPADRDPEVGEWLWNEIWTDDMKGSAVFYGKLAGYEKGSRILFGEEYSFLARDGKPRVGLVHKMDSKIGNTWAAYLRVADVNAIVKKAESLGGKILLAPNGDVREGSVAVIADPTGAGFVVQEWR